MHVNIVMSTTRFITPDEIDYLRVIYTIDKKNMGAIMSYERREMFLANLKEKMLEGRVHVAVVFDDNNNPIASNQGLEFQKVLAWRWAGISTVHSENHFNKSATLLVPAFDMMINLMESKGYYKFWAINKESNLNILYRILCKHSNLLHRYNVYDELIIPKGEKSGIPLFDMLRRPSESYDVLVRLYSLDQKHRVALLQRSNYEDYTGSV